MTPGWVSYAVAAVNAASSMIVIYFMQTVTADSGITSGLALLQGVQRFFYIALAYVLMMNAVHIYNENVLPRFNDGAVEIALFMLSFVSFLRHRMAPPIPATRTWEHHPPPKIPA